jgi:Na+/citrate or Na+/malate symporter
MTLTLSGAERDLGLRWVLATMIGWLVGFAVCEVIQGFLSTLFVDGLVIGTAVGIAQGLVLRPWIGSMTRFVVATIVGFGVGRAIGDLVSGSAPAVVHVVITALLIGGCVGVAQWLVLKSRASGSISWLPATIVAWVVGWIVIGFVEEAEATPIVLVYVASAIGAGAAGIISGAALVSLSRRRVRSSS